MVQEVSLAPILLKTRRISNYTQLIANLKLIQHKNPKLAVKSAPSEFSDVLVSKSTSFEYLEVIEGFLHEKLKDKFKAYRQEAENDINVLISQKIKEKKKEHSQKMYCARLGPLEGVEEKLFNFPTKFSFKEDLLFYLYEAIRNKQRPVEFLENGYIRYINSFLNFQKTSISRYSVQRMGGDSLEEAIPKISRENITNFARLRFNKEEYRIEAYEERYLWAELFVLFRIGTIPAVKELLNEFEVFFQFITKKFKTAFLEYLQGKTAGIEIPMRGKEDCFKRFFVGLINGECVSDGLVISTAEDYLWLKYIQKRDIRDEEDKFADDRIKIMICFLSRKYDKGVDILLRGNFSLVAKFYLMREIYLEQPFVHYKSSEKTFADMRTDGARSMAGESKFAHSYNRRSEESNSSLISMKSADEGSASESINPIFLNFMFYIASKMKVKENKIRFIEMLKFHEDYYNIVPVYIVKYEMYDIIGKEDKDGPLGYCLNSEIARRTVTYLEKSKKKKDLINLHNFIDPDVMVRLLGDVLGDCILSQEETNTEVVEKYLTHEASKSMDRLRNLYGLYRFNRSPTIANLKSTAIFDSSCDLWEYRHQIECVFDKAIQVIKKEEEREMAKTMFKLCGVLNLNSDCCNKASKELVLLL